eukprot:COSAG05_NODE_3912_length_1776_cov_155.137150_2_plen_162_part_00
MVVILRLSCAAVWEWQTHNGRPLKRKLTLELPSSGVLEFDFVSCYLHGKCRNGYDGSAYLPSDYQLQVRFTYVKHARNACKLNYRFLGDRWKALCAALPRAPAPSEHHSFHNLRLVIKPYLFTVKQVRPPSRPSVYSGHPQTEKYILNPSCYSHNFYSRCP